MANIINGSELMLYVEGRSIAFATAHTLNLNTETSDRKHKDNGVWSESGVTGLSWSASSENLYSTDGFSYLFNIYAGKTKVFCQFGPAGADDGRAWNENGLGYYNPASPHWSPANNSYQYSGYAYITSLTANANVGEDATFSIELSGAGPITYAQANQPT